jgi:uncharacterized zinc-type alcohol dehydrogenase-like protein
MIKAYAAFEPSGKLQPFEYDPGALGDHDVEIAVEHCSICHSDLSMLHNDWGITQYPFVPGHEIIGTIAAKGAHVSNLSVGQRVGLGWHAGYCMTCHSCLSGDHNLCAQPESTIVGHHGGFADKVRAKAASVVALPDGLNAQNAGPLFCGGNHRFQSAAAIQRSPHRSGRRHRHWRFRAYRTAISARMGLPGNGFHFERRQKEGSAGDGRARCAGHEKTKRTGCRDWPL